MIQYKVLQWAFSFLEKHRRERVVAEILLQFYTRKSRDQFYASMREQLPEHVVTKFKKAIKRHATLGIPVQHITKEAFFYGRKFFVNEDVLIPRPETEELIEKVIADVREMLPKRNVTIVDIGTGSGIIAITLALELPNATLYATDISLAALEVAKKNASALGANVKFLHGSYLTPLIERKIELDYIVANPPYIAETERESLADTVVQFDPEIALFAANDGLAAYEQIVLDIKQMQAQKNQRIFFEIGYRQKEAVEVMLRNNLGVQTCTTYKDINGNDRIVFAVTG